MSQLSTRQLQLFVQGKEGQYLQILADRVQGGAQDLSPTTRGRVFEQALQFVYGQVLPTIGSFSSALNGAVGSVRITGVPGTVVPRTWVAKFVGDVWVEWVMDTPVTIDASGNATATVKCCTNGAQGIAPEGTQLRLLPVISGTNSDVFVLAPGIQ